MLIRKEQMEMFEQKSWAELEQRTRTHVRKFFPKEVAELGEEATQKLVSNGIRRAMELQFSLEAEIYKFVDLTVLLGGKFDRELEWARRILSERDTSSADKMSLLMLAADEELRKQDDG